MPTMTAWKRLLQRQTVRPRSSVRVAVLLCALMFAVTATIVNRWGRERWVPVGQQTTYTATARAVEKRAGETTPFTITDVDPRHAKELADVRAERYAADTLAQWRCGKQDAWRKAHESAEESRRECRENAARLEAFERERREAAQTLADAKPREKPRPAMTDNPLWLDLRRQVSDLERRRDQLLQDRTPLHPLVQEIEGRLADVKDQLAATQRQVADNRVETAVSPDVPAIAAPKIDDLAERESQRKFDELTAALEKSRLACSQAERVEKETAQMRQTSPQFVIQYAEAVQNPPQVDYGWRRLLWTTLAASILMVFGIGSVTLGASIEPPVASVEEVEDELDESVLGVVPAEGDGPNVAAIHYQAQVRRAAIALGVVLIVACPIVAIWGITGI